jgi:hypothetical protein
MCPVCMTTYVLLVAGASAAGGLSALVAKDLREKPNAKASTKTIDQTTRVKGGHHDTAKNRRARSMASGA